MTIDLNNFQAKAMRRWLKKGPAAHTEQVLWALNIFLPILEEVGFSYVNTTHADTASGPYYIELERQVDKDSFDFISIYFDKYKRLQFSISSRRKKNNTSDWIRGGRVCWKQSELHTHNLWGARWWHIYKRYIFRRDVKRVAAILPHVFRFLETGEPHPNIYTST